MLNCLAMSHFISNIHCIPNILLYLLNHFHTSSEMVYDGFTLCLDNHNVKCNHFYFIMDFHMLILNEMIKIKNRKITEKT